MYALSVVPLIRKSEKASCLNDESSELLRAIQVWFADDAAAGGKLKAVRRYWDLLVQHAWSLLWLLPKTIKTSLV